MRREPFGRGLALLAALASVVTMAAIVWTLLGESLPFFREVSPAAFLLGTEWRPLGRPPAFGVLPLVAGTLLVTAGAGLIAVPLGLGTAIYLREYAPPFARRPLRAGLDLLAGLPTVVYGYLGLFFVTPLLRRLWPLTQAANAAAGAIVLGAMILPLVSSLCEEALAATPTGLREAAYGLGATRCEAVLGVVLPRARGGVAAAFVLALSRALGETMAVALAAGATPNLTLDPRHSVETMSTAIVAATEGDAATGSLKYASLFAVGLALFALTLGLNVLAGRLVRRVAA